MPHAKWSGVIPREHFVVLAGLLLELLDLPSVSVGLLLEHLDSPVGIPLELINFLSICSSLVCNCLNMSVIEIGSREGHMESLQTCLGVCEPHCLHG